MAWCLPKGKVQQFIKALKNKEINPDKLATMTSEERNKFLSKFVGEDSALKVNSLFESKLLLKNQKAGYISWAKRTAGLAPQAKRDIISRIERLDKVLNPQEEKMFLRDLAETRLGFGVTQEEAKAISGLSKKVQETRTFMKDDFTFENKAQRESYGRSVIALANYANDLKAKSRSQFSITKLPVQVAGNAKSIKASMDNSAIFRQGWKTLWTHPNIWVKNSIKTFRNIVKTFGGKDVISELNADVVSRPNYLNGYYKKAKLAVGTIEEEFPGSVIEKVPVIGTTYKASENAFTAFVHETRADVFDKYIQIAQKNGVNLSEKELKSIGSMVNSLTGRATLPGDLERAAGVFNNIFFSPRFFVSQLNTFTHPFTGAGGSGFVRKQASINLLKTIMGSAGVLAVASAVSPGSVETNPLSSNFGKIKVGNTRFDVTAGIAGIVTLASRIITQSSKSSTTGKVTPLNSGEYGALTTKEVIYNFFENKFSPPLAVMKDLAEGEDFDGNKPTIAGELKNLFVPLSISTYEELKKDPNSADTLLAMIADGLGIATNTYGQTVKDWTQKPTKTQQQFLDTVGKAKFKQANQEFNKQFDDWFSEIIKKDSYKNLSNENKQMLINNSKKILEEKILKKYGFKYKEPRKTLEQKQESRLIKNLQPK